MADFEIESRQLAKACGRVGREAFARAFNAKGHPEHEWRYSAEVIERFEELCEELVHLVADGEMERNPAHAAYAAARDARKNPALQALIRKASSKTPIRKA